MDDFATFCKNQQLEKKRSKNPQTLEANATPVPMGFFEARMNRDNFWNLMFAVLYIIGVGMGNVLPQTIGFIICWTTIIGVPILLKSKADIAFDKKTLHFIINGNKRMQKHCLGFITLMIASFFVCVLVSNTFIGLTPLAIVPSLYCILRNFPIAVYFRKEAWIGEGNATYSGADTPRAHNTFSSDVSQMNSPYNQMHNPINKHSAMNSHYR